MLGRFNFFMTFTAEGEETEHGPSAAKKRLAVLKACDVEAQDMEEIECLSKFKWMLDSTDSAALAAIVIAKESLLEGEAKKEGKDDDKTDPKVKKDKTDGVLALTGTSGPSSSSSGAAALDPAGGRAAAAAQAKLARKLALLAA